MTDDLTKEQRAFIPINKKGDLNAAVRLARTVLTEAIFASNFEDDPNGLAQLLAGEIVIGTGRTVEWDSFCAQMYAALAMGIAMGQLFHPDVFSGGAR